MNQRVHRRSKYKDDEPESVRVQRQIDRILARDFIQIHIPKTAGSTLRNALSTHATTGHFSALKLRRMITPEEWDQRFTFAFVRNPWDRMVSWFFFHQQFGAPDYRKYKSFETWIMSGMQTPWGQDWGTPDQSQDPLVCMDFLTNAKREILVDFVGCFERLEEDHKPDRAYYNDTMIEVVRERCKEDIERFGYEF